MGSSSHGAVHGAFGDRLAKSGRLNPKLHRYLLDAYRVRQSADYDAPADISEEDARPPSQTDPEFWKLIRARGKQPTLSLDQLRKRLRIKRQIVYEMVVELAGV